MAKRIILLSDGTGNAASQVWRTNVWRMFSALDLKGSDQVAIYDDGVGTSSFKPLALLGGAFGYGLKRNVIDLYTFVCRNYAEGDEIFAFGFSRGAFTVRIVTGLILNQGLVTADSDSDLQKKASAAYRAYRGARFFSRSGLERPFRALRDLFVAAPPAKEANRQVSGIRFLGVWDTVAAYGLPIDEMTRGIDKYIWPLGLPDRRLHHGVRRACHALALDDERQTFHPMLWTEADEQAPKPSANGTWRLEEERISQVWFAGMHSNVGGGYPDDALAHIPLLWIATEAEKCGLRFKPGALAAIELAADKDGRMYDSRQGLGAYYRYLPRRIEALCHARFSSRPDDAVEIELPKIHESALKRVRNGAHPYAPIGLPARYAMVDQRGLACPGPANPYEPPAAAAVRAKAQETMWDIVWQRRVLSFATLFVTIAFFVYPLFAHPAPAAEFASPIRWLSQAIRLVGSVLPGPADGLVETYARQPLVFAGFAGTILAMILLGAGLATAISDEMANIWRWSVGATGGVPPKDRLVHRLVRAIRTNPVSRRAHALIKTVALPLLSAVAILLVAAIVLNHTLFVAADTAGLVCRGTDEKNRTHLATAGEKATAPFTTNQPCAATGIWLEENARYSITLTVGEPWFDATIPTPVTGFSSIEAEGLAAKLAMVAGAPLKRTWFQPWFGPTLRIGETGRDQRFAKPGGANPSPTILQQTLCASHTGELFLYVNDAVIAVPGLLDLFYGNNKGTAELVVQRL